MDATDDTDDIDDMMGKREQFGETRYCGVVVGCER